MGEGKPARANTGTLSHQRGSQTPSGLALGVTASLCVAEAKDGEGFGAEGYGGKHAHVRCGLADGVSLRRPAMGVLRGESRAAAAHRHTHTRNPGTTSDPHFCCTHTSTDPTHVSVLATWLETRGSRRQRRLQQGQGTAARRWAASTLPAGSQHKGTQ